MLDERDQEPTTDDSGDDPDLDDVFEELEELEGIVDSDAEREQVRETMRTLHRAKGRGRFGRLRESFDTRDAGEALLGSFLFGIPMIVEGGTYEVGTFIARTPLSFVSTFGIGLVLVLGILHAVGFEQVEDDLLFGVVPVRFVGIVTIAGGLAITLLTLWGRVDWADPVVATSQTLVVAIVMAVGASLGDILPET